MSKISKKNLTTQRSYHALYLLLMAGWLAKFDNSCFPPGGCFQTQTQTDDKWIAKKAGLFNRQTCREAHYPIQRLCEYLCLCVHKSTEQLQE